MNNGWIKMHRKMTEWEWYQNTNVVRVFLHCLLKANHKDKKWQGNEIKKGSFITSYKHISDELSGRHSKISMQQVRTALNKLKSTGELTIKTTTQFSLIQLNNWSEYQTDNTRLNKQITHEQQTDNKRITTTKNDKNVKNDKKYSRFTPPTLLKVKEYIDKKGFTTIDPEYFINFYESKGWMIGKNKMKSWKSAISGWEARSKKENPTTEKTTERKKYEEKFNKENGYYPPAGY